MTYFKAVETITSYEADLHEHPLTGPIEVSEDCTLLTGDCRLRLLEQGFDHLCRGVAAPAEYVKRLDRDVQQLVLQRHLDKGELDARHLTLISRGDEFLSFGRADLRRITGREVLEAIQDGVGKDLDVHRLEIHNECVQAELLVESASEEVAPGDVLRAGLQVSHSLIGGAATWIQSFILRLKCSNGMTHRECVKRLAARTRRLPIAHKDARQMQIAQVRRIALETSAALAKKLQTIRDLQNQPVDVDQMLTRWLSHARLSPRLWIPKLQNAWEVEGSQPTAYGVMNALTRVATHEVEISSRQRRVMSGLAGVLAFQRLHLCPRCFSHLHGPASGGDAVETSA